ncbi:hypothetical protein ACGFJT_40255 [Actinomadura geliboluensis]|uniref:hypothetical protein n=1 Tax=Actinomadura geliboluensis TaxID=882440 RepID=UPI00371B6015
MEAGGAERRHWILYLVGAITYTEGHGIYLAANSIFNVAPSGIAHLWDEAASHYPWYGGLVLVFIVLAMVLAQRAAPGRPLDRLGPAQRGDLHHRVLEGNTAVAGIFVAAGFAVWGWITRDRLGRLMLIAFVFALLMIITYGIWQSGFPEPSELGWI